MNRPATLDDLEKELWLRYRDYGEIYIKDKYGKAVSIKNADFLLLAETIIKMRKDAEEEKNEQEYDHIYDED